MLTRSIANHTTSDQLCEGPHLVGYTIYHNDRHHHLQINGRLVRLSPTEYILCMRLLRHAEWLQQFAVRRQQRGKFDERAVPNVYVSFDELQNCANLGTRQHVTKHISNANSKLKVHGIAIICVAGCGYTLDFRPDEG